MEKTYKILIMFLIIIGGILVCNNAYAKGGNNADVEIFNKNGESMQVAIDNTDDYMYDSAADYKDCYGEIYLYEEENKYEQSITIDCLGTFNYLEARTDQYNGTYQVYRCNKINEKFLTTPGNVSDVDFKLKNLATGNYEDFYTNSCIETFKDQFESNANLSVAGIDVVKNGKYMLNDNSIYKNPSNYMGTYIGDYNRSTNILSVSDNYINTIKYNNMGRNFEIFVHENGSYYYPYSGLKYSPIPEAGWNPGNSYIDGEKITSGKTYDSIVNTLGSGYKNLQVYDVSLKNSYTNEKMELVAKIKLYLPIENNINSGNMEVYRIEENGNKVKYNETIEKDGEKNYAVFETDKFGTFAITEKIVQVKLPKHVPDIQKVIFDNQYYIASNIDLERFYGFYDYAGAWEHFNYHGIDEGRAGSPLFSIKYYKEVNSDLRNMTNKDAYEHFIYHGIEEGRTASPLFDVHYYVEAYPDLKAAFTKNGEVDYGEAYDHYVYHGIYEGRNPSSNIDLDFYVHNYWDLTREFIKNGVVNWEQVAEHWFFHGVTEGREGKKQ